MTHKFQPTMESFEAYCHNESNNEIIEKTKQIMIQYGLDTLYMSVLSEAKTEGYAEPRKQYGIILKGVKEIYTIVEMDLNFTNEFHSVKNLLYGMYELDTKCGIEYELNQSSDKCMILLNMLDDKIKFGKILMECIPKIMNQHALRIFLFFGRLLYTFNEYQPPKKNNVKRIVLDMCGYIDHYQEYIDDIFNQLKYHQ